MDTADPSPSSPSSMAMSSLPLQTQKQNLALLSSSLFLCLCLWVCVALFCRVDKVADLLCFGQEEQKKTGFCWPGLDWGGCSGKLKGFDGRIL
jgi:hypothetical protein